jgi:hypothetical protein
LPDSSPNPAVSSSSKTGSASSSRRAISHGPLLAWLAERGVQILVETHSDHLVNGIRRGIAEHGYSSQPMQSCIGSVRARIQMIPSMKLSQSAVTAAIRLAERLF